MAASSNALVASIRFGNAQLLPAERRLLVDGGDVVVGGRAFDVLLALIERRDRLVTRNEVLDLVWPDIEVELNNVDVQVGNLRKLLGPQVIATIPGRGFRFSATVDDSVRAAQPAEQVVFPIFKRRTHLPERLQGLIGRADDLELVGGLIDAHRIVTIVGAGGIGKTRLAERLLSERRSEYKHGVCWIEMASIADAAALPAACAAALGINLSGGDPGAALAAALAPLEILIGLDNAEHLVAGTGQLVEAILAATASVRILVTSQAPLHVPDEQVVRLSALSIPPSGATADDALGYGAVDLFVQRARAADARFAFDDAAAAAVIRLCERLDGSPLAIEIAAARAPLFGVERILASLDQRLGMLKGGFRSAPPRQQTMQAALEWSHHLLGPNERVVFRRLAVLAGSASLELIQSIVADTGHTAPHTTVDADGELDRWTVVDAIGALIDRSLVTIVDDGDLIGPRYRLLETPRAYALDRLVSAGEVAMLEERHARAMAVVLTDAWTERWSGRIGYVQWMGRVDADRDNARTAFSWAWHRQAIELVLAMAPMVMTRSWFDTIQDGRTTIVESIEQMLAAQPIGPSQLRTRVQLMRFWGQRDVERSLSMGRAALSLADACGDRFTSYFIEASSVRSHCQLRDLGAAAAALERTDALEDPAWPAIRLVAGAEARSVFHYVQGPPQAALEPSRRELQVARLAGHDGHVTASNMITLDLMTGAYASAAAHARDLLDQMADSRNESARLHVRLNLLGALLALSDLEQAGPVARDAWRSAPYFDLQGGCADQLALMCALEKRWEAAATLNGYANAVYTRRGARRWPAEATVQERTVSLVNAALDAVSVERLELGGARLPDEAVAQVAFELG